MKFEMPAFNLKAKLMALMVVLLGLTLGAEVIVSLGTQLQIVETTRQSVRDLASAIQISVEELTSVGPTDRERLQNYVKKLHTQGLEVSIVSSRDRIINSSNPRLIGAALRGLVPKSDVIESSTRGGYGPFLVTPFRFGFYEQPTTVYLIPVEVEDHVVGYVQLVANFGNFAQTLHKHQLRLLSSALLIFAIGLIFSYVLAQRYVRPLHLVAAAAQNIAERGLEAEPMVDVRRRDEIGLLTRSFNEMVRQLRRARERETELARLERFTALGQLAGGLAHEIKNPLNFISLAVDQVRTRYAPAPAAERDTFLRQLLIVKEEIRRLSELIQSFLQYGKPIEIHPAPTDLHRLVHNVLALSESKLKSQDVEVVEQGAGVPALLNVDAEKLHACFVNVVANATQAMPEGGRLVVRFARADGKLQVDFSDTGEGVDPELAGRIFEPFFTTKREGIGLGLFFSKAIVEKHGGTIAIGPNPAGRGTSVTFTFPATPLHKQP